MAKKQKIDIREKTVEVLKKDLADARSALSLLRLDNTMRKLQNTRSIFLKRKEIARLLTVIGEKSVQQMKGETK